MLKTYAGSCHCGTVRFEADADIGAGTGKCNCTFCRKARLWSVRVGTAAFRIVAGEVDMTDYRGGNPVAHHLFCRVCGVRPFERVDLPNMTGAVYWNVNVACLDGVDMAELAAAPVEFQDGLRDRWGEMPEDVRGL